MTRPTSREERDSKKTQRSDSGGGEPELRQLDHQEYNRQTELFGTLVNNNNIIIIMSKESIVYLPCYVAVKVKRSISVTNLKTFSC